MVSPFTVAHPARLQSGRGGAPLPAAEGLINQAESRRGAPPIQAFRREQTRTRANPFFILPGVSFSCRGLCCVRTETESRRPAIVSLRAASVCVWRELWGGGWRKGGAHVPMPFLPPFFFLLSLIMKYCDQAANEPKLPPVSLFFAFRLSLQSKLLLPASCSSNITPAGPSPLPPPVSFSGLFRFSHRSLLSQGGLSHLSYLNLRTGSPPAMETSFLWRWVESGFKYLHNTRRYNL